MVSEDPKIAWLGNRFVWRLRHIVWIGEPFVDAGVEQLGEFIRIEADERDGRSKRVFLTRQGRAAREDAIRAARPHLDRVASAVGREGVLAIMPELQRLRAWLDQNRDM